MQSGKRTIVWCDASVDSKTGCAYGAYMTKNMSKPVVLKLQEATSVGAEIETMTRALLVMPKQTVIMTDLANLSLLIEQHKTSWARSMLRLLKSKNATYQYVTPELRDQMYGRCHYAARWRMRQERDKQKNKPGYSRCQEQSRKAK